jgi:hypothetical protein
VSTRLTALGDDDVDAGVGVLARLARRAAQRGHLAALGVDVVDHVLWRGTERVGDQSHLRMLESDLDLRRGGRFRPAQQAQRALVVLVGEWHTVIDEDLAGKVEMLLRDHVREHLAQLVGGQVGVHALVLVGDDDVDAVGVVADVLVDPVEFYLELLGGEADGAEHAESTRLADGDDHVAAVCEGEDRELDAELIAEGGVHASS